MRHNLLLGVTLCLISTLFYSSMNAVFKAQAATLPPLPIVVFVQSFVSLLLMSLLTFYRGAHAAKKIVVTQRAPLHMLRAVTSLTIVFTLFYAVQRIPLVNAVLLSNSAPLVVPFVGYLCFSEKINHRLWLPVVIGYIGVAIVLHPDVHFFQPAAIFALMSAVALAFTIQIVRRLTSTESTMTITFYFAFFSTLFAGLVSIPFWQPLSITQCVIMTMIGVLYCLSQFIANASMRYGNPQLISALMYFNIVNAVIISVLFWGVVPGFTTVMGMLLVITGSVACIWVEHLTVKKVMYLRE